MTAKFYVHLQSGLYFVDVSLQVQSVILFSRFTHASFYLVCMF